MRQTKDFLFYRITKYDMFNLTINFDVFAKLNYNKSRIKMEKRVIEKKNYDKNRGLVSAEYNIDFKFSYKNDASEFGLVVVLVISDLC